jgi:hypothetical protein
MRTWARCLPTHFVDCVMPLPCPAAFFRCNMGFLWAVDSITPAADADDAEAKVLIVSVPQFEEDMGTMANELTSAEWQRFRDDHRLVPCPPSKPSPSQD